MLSILEIIKNRPELAIIFAALSSMVIYQLKTLPGYIWSLYKRFLTVNLEVDSQCSAFYLLDKWLNKQRFSNKNKNLQLINTSSTSKEEIYLSTKQVEYNLHWRLSAGFGFYIFVYKKTLIIYNKSRREKSPNTNNYSSSTDIFTGKLTALTRNKQIFIDIVDELVLLSTKNEGTPIYTFQPDYWDNHETRKVRSLNSVTLREGQMEKIVSEINFFLDNKNYYIRKGIPYRKGHLFSGPPGTGKTSLILALAAHFNKSIYIVNLSSLIDDQAAYTAISKTAPDSFVVLEDIDCIEATNDRQKKENNKEKLVFSGVTTQGLLNILDGIITPENRLYFMTTNHPEKLDPAFLRPGRVDVHEILDKLEKLDQARMANFFYENDDFIGLDFPISPAELQKAFMLYSSEPAKAKQFLLDNKLKL
jgi:chaperone BCS1